MMMFEDVDVEDVLSILVSLHVFVSLSHKYSKCFNFNTQHILKLITKKVF